MADDTTGWSEKGKRTPGDADGDGKSATPSRPSKRQATSSKGGESSIVRTPASDDAGARKVAKAAATAGQRDVSFASRMGFPALIALICLLGIGVVVYARSTRDALAEPVQNLDHWHAVYGVYNCNATGEGDAKFLPGFLSTQDDTGIHSHGDGVMHIHPFFELSSGDNAQIRHWMSEMNIEITPERISVNNQFDPPVELAAGQECLDGTGKAEIKLLRWQFDFQATDGGEPDVITEDFGLVQFQNDREVFMFAYVSEDTDVNELPPPPADRFETLNNVSSAIDYNPTQLNPIETGVDIDDADAEVDE
ncbi:MAG: hypothetical protein HOK58_03060 [Acidimicrobiaceae bacterium]|nr:hypothetical protein [Acidimicrobiaceae bacterium]